MSRNQGIKFVKAIVESRRDRIGDSKHFTTHKPSFVFVFVSVFFTLCSSFHITPKSDPPSTESTSHHLGFGLDSRNFRLGSAISPSICGDTRASFTQRFCL